MYVIAKIMAKFLSVEKLQRNCAKSAQMKSSENLGSTAN